MWILHFLPDGLLSLIINIIFWSGLFGTSAGLFIGDIPLVSRYRIPVLIIGVILLSLGTYFKGGYATEMEWRAKVEQLQNEIKVAEVKSHEVNTVIETKVVEKVKIVKENTYVNLQTNNEVVAHQLNFECSLPNSAVMLHNSASQNEVATGAGISDGRTSDVKASELLGTVIENYGTYYQVVEKLKGWQEWYKEQKKIHDDIKQQ